MLHFHIIAHCRKGRCPTKAEKYGRKLQKKKTIKGSIFRGTWEWYDFWANINRRRRWTYWLASWLLQWTMHTWIQQRNGIYLIRDMLEENVLIFTSKLLISQTKRKGWESSYIKGPSTLATLFSHRWPRFCGGDIYSRRKPLFSSFGEHTAVCGSSVRQTVARPRHRQSVFVAAFWDRQRAH